MEKERLKFCIERFDHYFDSVNNKSGLFLGLNTFIVGGLFAGYNEMLKRIDCDLYAHILILAMIILGVISILFLISASTPFNGKKQETLYYFGSIAGLSQDDFMEKSNNRDDSNELEDLRIQVHQLSIGLKRKYHRLKIVGRLFLFQFLFLIPIIVLIVINIK